MWQEHIDVDGKTTRQLYGEPFFAISRPDSKTRSYMVKDCGHCSNLFLQVAPSLEDAGTIEKWRTKGPEICQTPDILSDIVAAMSSQPSILLVGWMGCVCYVDAQTYWCFYLRSTPCCFSIFWGHWYPPQKGITMSGGTIPDCLEWIPWQALESEQLRGVLYQEELVWLFPAGPGGFSGWVFVAWKNGKDSSRELRVNWVTCFFPRQVMCFFKTVVMYTLDLYFSPTNWKEHTPNDRSRQQFKAVAFLFECLVKSLNSWIGAFIIQGWIVTFFKWETRRKPSILWEYRP